MIWILFIGVIIFFVVVTILKEKGNTQKSEIKDTRSDKKKEFNYQKIECLFTPAERSFYGVLKQIVGIKAEVFGKVRVADILVPEKGMSKSNWQTAFNKVAAKHFDFILCSKNDLSILCAIELDDSSHGSESRNERDAFLDQVCKKAQVNLIRIPAKQTYSLEEIKEKLPNLTL